jgi:cation diffusion facilitator family transporter
MAGGSTKSILYALGANFGIAVAKSVAAVFTGSGSMIAEAIHSYADCANQLLLLIGLKRAKKAPSPNYPMGYGKEIYFYSFIVALMLFSIGGLFSMYEGFHKLHATEQITNPMIAIGVLSVSIILEALSLKGCMSEINIMKGDKPLWQWTKDTSRSELVVVLGEDIAALFGLIFALIAISLSVITGNPIYDAIGSIVIGVLLIIVAIFIAVKIKGLLIGRSVNEEQRIEIENFINNYSEIDVVLNLITIQLGSDIMLAVKAKMNDELSAKQLITTINKCEASIKGKFSDVKWIFFEPDNKE